MPTTSQTTADDELLIGVIQFLIDVIFGDPQHKQSCASIFVKMGGGEESSSSSCGGGGVGVANARYRYIHDDREGPLEAIDAHHVVVRKSIAVTFLVYLSALILTTTAFSLFLLKGKSIHILLWSLLLSVFLVKLFLRKPVEKESIIIMPAFGVQLETQYRSGRIIHRFIPINKILKPVLNECVTPVTCYWSLSLILREEEELTLVFKEICPPVKMLIPIWKALCAATDSPGTVDDPIR